MSTFPTDAEREAVRRTAWTVDDAQDGWHMVDTTLDALAPFVAAREAQAAARALREAAEAAMLERWGEWKWVVEAVAKWLHQCADRIEAGES